MNNASQEKPSLSFYTNMPTPYQLDFFHELAFLFNLNVTYFTSREADRQWELEDGKTYSTRTLRNVWVAKLIQKKIVSFHFSWSIISRAWSDSSPYAVVNGTYWSPNIVMVMFIRWLRKRPVYFWGEPVFGMSNGVRHLIKKHLLAMPLRLFSSGLFAIGVRAVESYRSLGYKKEISNLPYNIRTELFRDDMVTEGDILINEWKRNGETILLSSGALVKRKGMDILVKAFLPLENCKARLVILGDGIERDHLENLAGGSSRIYFAGFRNKEEIPAYFKQADIFVFASRYDGWGLVINEAFAAGLAIISSAAVGAAADKLRNGANGMIIETERPEDWTTAMRSLIEDKEKRRQLASESAQTALELSSKFNAKKLYDILTTT